MITCPKCGCEESTKDGIVKGRQRHKCKSCGDRHTVQHCGGGKRALRSNGKRLSFILKGLVFAL